MKTKLAVAVLAMAIFAVGARAWPSCSGNWISVPAGTSTANGAIVTENGQTFQCQKPTPTPTPSTISATSAANSAANSASSASANQSQKQGQTQTANGGSATGGSATGGSASLKDSGNSSSTVKDSGNSSSTMKNSGNSSNSNVNNVQGGEASNNSSGNQTTVNDTSVTNIPRQTASAIAPDTIPTSPCFKSFSGAGQGPAFGFSFGGGKIDKGCDDRETARLFAVAGNRIAFAKIMCDTPAAKRANLTFDECLYQVPVPIPVAVTPVPISAVQPTIIVPAPQVVIQAPTPVVTQTTTNEGVVYAIGSCKLFNRRPSNACYRFLDDAVRALEGRPTARLIITGPIESTKVLSYLDGKIARSRIELRLDDDANSTLTFETWSVQ